MKKPTRKRANPEAGKKFTEETFPADPTPAVESTGPTMGPVETDSESEPTDAEFTASIIDLMRQHLSDEHSTDEEIVACWCGQYGQGGAA